VIEDKKSQILHRYSSVESIQKRKTHSIKGAFSVSYKFCADCLLFSMDHAYLSFFNCDPKI